MTEIFSSDLEPIDLFLLDLNDSDISQISGGGTFLNETADVTDENFDSKDYIPVLNDYIKLTPK